MRGLKVFETMTKTQNMDKIFMWLLVLCGAVCLAACDHSKKIDQEFMIPVEGSKLYVRIIGNAQGPLILTLHGGPGALSGFDHEFNKDYLEKENLVVYLDQRGGGKSDKEPDSTMLNMQQFVKDVDIVIDTLRNRYKGKKLNLMGSSWGGTLGLLYLIEHQQKINAYACISGKADGIMPIMSLVEHEEELIDKKLKENSDTADRRVLQEMREKLSEIKESDLNEFYNDMNLVKLEYPEKLGFDPYWANTEAQQKAKELGNDPGYYERAHYTKKEFEAAMDKAEYINRVFRNSSDYNHLNILNEIGVIRIPVLVMQGEQDYAIGVQQAKLIYDALHDVPEYDKRLTIIPGAAHNLNMEATDQYFTTLTDFFGNYN